MTKIQDVSLEELIDIKHGFAFKSDFFQSEPSDYILLTPGNFNVNQTLYFGRNTKYYLGDVPSGYVLDNGDLLVVMTDLTKEMNILGNAVILQSKKKVLHNQRIGKITIKDHQAIAKDYLMYVLNSETVRNNIKATASGTTVRHTSPKKILELVIPLPPLLEQCRIAEVLGVWDESIDLLERLIGRVRSRKQGLMQQLLTGKKRFKEFEGSEWKEYQLSQIANITMGTSPKSESYNSNEEGLPLLQGNADIKNRVSAPRIWTTEITKECYPDDILISVRAPVGTVAISLHHACIGRGIASVRAKSKIISNYLYQLLLFSEPKWASLSQGSTFDSVNSADIKSRVFSIPLMIPEQGKIAAVLSAADEEISTLEKQLAAYKQQKLGLMQQLLTGKIRVGMI
jgi:type I restriction enzyme, S subunit